MCLLFMCYGSSKSTLASQQVSLINCELEFTIVEFWCHGNSTHYTGLLTLYTYLCLNTFWKLSSELLQMVIARSAKCQVLIEDMNCVH